jgi:hypothetical protein
MVSHMRRSVWRTAGHSGDVPSLSETLLARLDSFQLLLATRTMPDADEVRVRKADTPEDFAKCMAVRKAGTSL